VQKLEYTLPDGKAMSIEGEWFHVAEPLYKPHFIGKSVYGLHQEVEESIRSWYQYSPNMACTFACLAALSQVRNAAHFAEEIREACPIK